METKSIFNIVRDNYAEYGREVNTNRSIANLDGLKLVHRRILQAAWQFNNGNMVSTAKLSGDTTGNLHPHSTDSVNGAISMMVRWGVLKGVGNHGSDGLMKLPEAASRYTKAGLNKTLEEYFFKLYKYCKFREGELDTREPEFLITPIPVCLITGGSGIGLGGVVAKYPRFTYKSLLDAYLANDYTKLVSATNPIIDSDDELKRLWKTGMGSLKYQLNVTQEFSKDDGVNVTIISGPLNGILPNLSVFDSYVEQGRVSIRNESSRELRVVVFRTSGTKAISDEEVFNLCKSISTKTIAYRLTVSFNGKVKILGIKNWINMCYSTFTKFFNKYKQDKINEYTLLIEEYSILPKVGKMVIDNKTNQEIVTQLKISPEMLARCLKHPISMLRKKDFTDKINNFKKLLEETKKLDSTKTSQGYSEVWATAITNYVMEE